MPSLGGGGCLCNKKADSKQKQKRQIKNAPKLQEVIQLFLHAALRDLHTSTWVRLRGARGIRGP